MSADFEKVSVALLARFKARLGGRIKEYSRRSETFDQVSSEMQPALVQMLLRASADSAPGTPTTWTLYYVVVLLARAATDDHDKTSETELNALVGMVEDALKRQDGESPFMDPEHTTLGGLVTHCFINGVVDYVQGEAGEQSFAMLPIEVLVVK